MNDVTVMISRAVVEQAAAVMAYRSCARRGPRGHYNSVRCFDQGAPNHGSNEYENKPLAKEKWCDGCAALMAFKEALRESPSRD
jgi:hypothetical protein